MHPSAPLHEKILNRHKNHVLEDLIVTGEGTRIIWQESQEKPVSLMLHPNFEDVEFFAFKQYATMVTKGPPK